MESDNGIKKLEGQKAADLINDVAENFIPYQNALQKLRAAINEVASEQKKFDVFIETFPKFEKHKGVEKLLKNDALKFLSRLEDVPTHIDNITKAYLEFHGVENIEKLKEKYEWYDYMESQNVDKGNSKGNTKQDSMD